jgi:hypothetical protein
MPQDAQRVNLTGDYEVRYWMEKFSVTCADLERAVQKVGVMAKDVEGKGCIKAGPGARRA